MHSVLVIVFLFGTVFSTNSSTNIEVSTPEGTIVGNSNTYNDSPLHEFLGIPFAEPPIGDLRFRKTRPLTLRPETLFAQTMPPACPQYVQYDYPWYDNKPFISEDCLYLNIWVPGYRTQEKKAVMFWIHGGGFTYGSNRLDIFNGRILATENDVIVVSPNFRLGALGFLSSDSKLAPGNMGLYDILEALKWVKNNIEYFGGNSKKVTIFGESSGINAEELVRALNSLNPTNIQNFNFITGDELVPLNPKSTLLSGNVNNVSVFLGFDQDEGSLNLIFSDTNYFGGFGEKNPFFNKTVGSGFILDGLKKFVCFTDVVRHYLGHVNEYDYQEVREQTYHALGDFFKTCPVIYFGDSFAKAGRDVYFYYFNHRPAVSQFAYWMGVYHFSQVQFTFGRPLADKEGYTGEEIDLSRYMMTLWTNFAKYGKPTNYIEKSTPLRRNYIYIGTNEWKSSYLQNHEENCEFYKTYFDQQEQ
ncbi:acetylcholinesterase-like [Uloborus diversus]|uniref:acetylcholinesterase-like n=1 Tax=Uloborus diversus TaxID=327109 RepID=UPI00240A6CC5|nr:acetylcholinesterase-like [Uloborus diversus]